MKLIDRNCVLVVFLVVLLFSLVSVPLCFAVGSEEANVAMEEAEDDLGSAFVMVAVAQGAGANVNVLLDALNGAGVFLSEARSAFRVGDYESAFSSAVSCSDAVRGVVDEAARLKVDAEVAHNAELLATAAESGFGVGLLLIFAFLGWRFLKGRYYRRILDTKPKAEESQ